MHCDDKRTLFALKERIEKTWNELRDSDFNDEEIIKQLNEMILEYQNYKEASDDFN